MPEGSGTALATATGLPLPEEPTCSAIDSRLPSAAKAKPAPVAMTLSVSALADRDPQAMAANATQQAKCTDRWLIERVLVHCSGIAKIPLSRKLRLRSPCKPPAPAPPRHKTKSAIFLKRGYYVQHETHVRSTPRAVLCLSCRRPELR